MILLANNGITKYLDEARGNSKDRKFKESVELSINMKDLDLSNPKNRINEEIYLPKGRGKQLKVALIGTEEMQLKAKDVADYIYGPEDLNEFGDDKKAFKKIVQDVDFFIAESTLMATIGKSLGQVLGPRGKMPKPVPPGQDPSSMVSSLKQTVRARSRDKRTFHVPVGTKEMSNEDLSENISAVIKRIVGKLERGYNNVESVYVKTTMGKAVKVELGDIQ